MIATTRIAFRRTGGILDQAMELILDLDQLPQNEAQHLERLVGNADFFKLPENLIALSTSQEFQYTLTVKARSNEHTVQVTDTAAPGSLRTLIDELAVLAVFSKHGFI